MYKAVATDINNEVKTKNFLNTINQFQVNTPSLKSL